uniref:RNA-directed DNA polymerase, eukaryota n=1 Tax=Tanacetum cinerariifolium TaxID=118510 RepID=A0A699IZX5_TANCI|nr:RNA-directed DNA polymerase, eukaryota [Tanacetum cinerariifolium]
MLESMKDIQVATKLSHVDLEWSFRRKSRGGAEQIQMTILKEILEGYILSDTKGRWMWSLEGPREFSVSSIRKTIDAAFLPCGNVKTRWVKEVPIKINILAWKVSNDYLPTRLNLSRRGAARRWLEKEPPRSITTWDDLGQPAGGLKKNPRVPSPLGMI